jgi:hypothetical protein
MRLAISSTPHTKAISPLLKLPSELRNHIYQCALSAELGLRFKSWETSPAWAVELSAAIRRESPVHSDHAPPQLSDLGRCGDDSPAGRFNQLKYTCRQLYHETAGLEVRFNGVWFFDCNETNCPTPCFINFINKCSPRKVAWFMEITLQVFIEIVDLEYLVEPLASLLPVADFCRNHPKINVRYLPDHFHAGQVAACTFFLVGSYLDEAYRGKDPHPALSGVLSGGYYEVFSPTWRADTVGIAALNLPNFRFWPVGFKYFDEKEFRESLNKDKRFDHDHQVYVDIAKEWHNNGI